MTARLLLFAVAMLIAQPVLPAADRLEQARTAVKAQRLDRAEELLRQHLRSRKTDLDARYLLARVLAWQKKYAAALVEYEALIKANPRDADYFLGKAQTLFWDGKWEQALPPLRTARRLAPRYEDVWRLQITVLIALGDEYRMRQARTIRATAAKLFPRSQWHFAALDPATVATPAAKPPETAALPASAPPAAAGDARPTAEPVPAPVTAVTGGAGAITATESARDAKPATPGPTGAVRARPRSEFELGASYETLSGDRSPWRSVYLDGLHRFSERQLIYGTLRETRRFDLSDSEARAGLYYPLGETWTSLVEGTVSPTHNVLANHSVLGQLQKTLAYGWNLQAGIRHSKYSAFSTDVAILTAERNWSSFRGAYTLYLARPEGGGSVPNHVAQFSYYYGDRSSIGVAIANGREIADLNTGIPLITDVRSYTLYGSHWMTPDWAISFEALHHEQGTLYTRTAARIGLRRAF